MGSVITWMAFFALHGRAQHLDVLSRLFWLPALDSSAESSSKRGQMINLTLLPKECSLASRASTLLSYSLGTIVSHTRDDSDANGFVPQDSTEQQFLPQRCISVKETGI